jgi:hypothetical protein
MSVPADLVANEREDGERHAASLPRATLDAVDIGNDREGIAAVRAVFKSLWSTGKKRRFTYRSSEPKIVERSTPHRSWR